MRASSTKLKRSDVRPGAAFLAIFETLGVLALEAALPVTRFPFVMSYGHDVDYIMAIKINSGKRKTAKNKPLSSV